MKTLIFLIFVSAAVANPIYYFVRCDSKGLVLEYHATPDPNAAEGRVAGPGETVAVVPWTDLHGYPTLIQTDGHVSAHVPTLRVVNGRVKQRLKADVDADADKARALRRAECRIDAKARRLAAEAVAAERPGDQDAAKALDNARAAELLNN